MYNFFSNNNYTTASKIKTDHYKDFVNEVKKITSKKTIEKVKSVVSKIFKVILVLILITILSFVVFIYIFFVKEQGSIRVASCPSCIANEADFNLPEYTVLSRTDNMDRPSSAWSCYEWDLKLCEPLTSESIEALKKLVKKNEHWTYNGDKHIYTYSYDTSDVRYSITISVDTYSVYMYYEWWDFGA